MATVNNGTPSNGKTILITGSTGFIGSHITAAFLENGYLVRVAVRSLAAGHHVFNTHSDYTDRLSLCIVPDITIHGAFDNAVRGVDGIIHSASPFHFNAKGPCEIVDPAISGTISLLESAHRFGSGITRVVNTSSIAAILDPSKGLRPGYTYTEADWNPIAAESLATADSLTLYLASKALAEQAAWKFMDNKKPNFTLTTICPPLTYGPIIHHVKTCSNLNTSIADFYRLMNGTCAAVPNGSLISCVFVDVRDVAKAHLLAFESPKAAGQRYLVVNGPFNYQQVVDILRSEVIQARENIPVGQPGLAGPECYRVSNSKSSRELRMIYRTLAETVIDTANSLLRIDGVSTRGEFPI
ncbi:cinnamoyl-CoA reductase [Penicillium lividum]|nr:cinnamoyl-CoA reductase [Penicillium lividum]